MLLPEPLTPVMTTKRSRGMVNDKFLRLCSRAPWMEMTLSDLVRITPKLITREKGMAKNLFRGG